LTEKWLRNDNPRVRNAWLDREILGSKVVWEKGQPMRAIKEAGRHRHEPVPHWTTNMVLARRLLDMVGPIYPAPQGPPETLCLRALHRHLQLGPGLWSTIKNPSTIAGQRVNE